MAPPRSNRVMVTLRIDASVLAKVDEVAQARGMTRTDWLRRIIDRGLAGTKPEVTPRFRR